MLSCQSYIHQVVSHTYIITSLCNCRYATVRTQLPRDSIQNVDNAMASFQDGVTSISFSRLRDTRDVNDDISLNNCVHFLYSWGGAVSDINTGQIQYHGATRRFISDSLECIPSDCPERCKG